MDGFFWKVIFASLLSVIENVKNANSENGSVQRSALREVRSRKLGVQNVKGEVMDSGQKKTGNAAGISGKGKSFLSLNQCH